MKLLILILMLATDAIALELIYAINAGGGNYTDLDGIVYQSYDSKIRYKWPPYDIGNVPESDTQIYKFTDFTNSAIEYDVPLKSDGLFVLIVKFSSATERDWGMMSMTLNTDIQLLTNVELIQVCGGHRKICDKYFYFCVSDNKLHYKNQSSVIRDGVIHIENRAIRSHVGIAGLVLMKGTIGERRKLGSSATNETIYFDPLNTHLNCSATPINMLLLILLASILIILILVLILLQHIFFYYFL
jgi:Malectin domain